MGTRKGGPRASLFFVEAQADEVSALAQTLLERFQLCVQLGWQAFEFAKVLAELRQLRLPVLDVHPQELRDVIFGHFEPVRVDSLAAHRRGQADWRLGWP